MNKFMQYVSIYIKNEQIRFNVAILLGLIFNACYIVFNLVLGILYGNAWFVTVAAYYMLIAVLRYMLIESGGSEREVAEYSKTVASLMLILSVPMTGMIIYTVLTNTSHSTPRITLPVFAGYAFFSIFRAIFGLIANKKENASFRKGAHTIRLSLALLSLFNLQTSLLSFIGVNETLAIALNFTTGGAVSISVFAIAESCRTYEFGSLGYSKKKRKGTDI